MTNINHKNSISEEEISNFLLKRILSENLELIINNIKKQDPSISSLEALEIYLDFKDYST